ncbi:hypothetical protein GCM10027294_43540 [Marinactinospora endophytica]
MKLALYRFYADDGQLLYVGITNDPPRRMKQHSDSKDWWPQVRGISIDWYPDRDSVLAAERRAIAVENPLYNVAHKSNTEFVATTDLERLSRSIVMTVYDKKEAEKHIRETREIYSSVPGEVSEEDWLHDCALLAVNHLNTLYERALRELQKADEAMLELAQSLLALLDGEEAEEWMACAETHLGDRANSYTLPLFAARHVSKVKAAQRKEEAPFLGGMCAEWGDHGAQCPHHAEFKVFLADCGEQPCLGHDVCESHLEKIINGTSRTRYTVTDFVEIVPDND